MVLLVAEGNPEVRLRIHAPGGGALAFHDVASAGQVVIGRCELQGALPTFEGYQVLHTAFAEGARPDEHRAVVVFERPGDDL